MGTLGLWDSGTLGFLPKKPPETNAKNHQFCTQIACDMPFSGGIGGFVFLGLGRVWKSDCVALAQGLAFRKFL